MYFLLEKVDFQLAMLVYWRVICMIRTSKMGGLQVLQSSVVNPLQIMRLYIQCADYVNPLQSVVNPVCWL